MPVFTMEIPLEIGVNWMTTRLKETTDRSNTPRFMLGDVPGRFTSHIEELLEVSNV